jgi:hypothetical protein
MEVFETFNINFQTKNFPIISHIFVFFQNLMRQKILASLQWAPNGQLGFSM